MSENKTTEVNVTVDGKRFRAPDNLSVIQALWHAGYPRVKSVGCLEGVCGSCRVMVRRPEQEGVTMELACQTLIEEGMQAIFMIHPTPTHHEYNLEEIQNSWDVQAEFHRIFPEASHCRNCKGCTTACPKGIQVQHGVELACQGKFREASELFVECVMCNLCMTGCPEEIAPNHVGLFTRRVTAYFHTRPANLIHRLEAIRQGDLKVEIS